MDEMLEYAKHGHLKVNQSEGDTYDPEANVCNFVDNGTHRKQHRGARKF